MSASTTRTGSCSGRASDQCEAARAGWPRPGRVTIAAPPFSTREPANDGAPFPTRWGWAFVTLGVAGIVAAWSAWGLARDRQA